MKNVLIISPYFPPCNAADMHRVRMSLPYFKEFGWNAEVVCVYDSFTDITKDYLLLDSLPKDLLIHKVKAFSLTWTKKLGLGSLALRSLWFFYKKVNQLLRLKHYDLIYFSTTQFPICVLGPCWKNKFGIPYIIDMQDPWHSEYYTDKPKSQRPAKHWFSYRLNKFLEPLALKRVGGLISVSKSYIEDVKARYPEIVNIPSSIITFGSFDQDLLIATEHKEEFIPLLDPFFKNVVYIGRGGNDMEDSLKLVFNILLSGIELNQTLKKLRFYFIGTSYAPRGQGKKTIYPIAQAEGVQDQVIEITGRISFYHALSTLQQADALFIPGSDDSKYTPSKIYPYLQTRKPLLAVFNKESSGLKILQEYGIDNAFSYECIDRRLMIDFFNNIINNNFKMPTYNLQAIKKHSAKQMTFEQCHLFDRVINEKY